MGVAAVNYENIELRPLFFSESPQLHEHSMLSIENNSGRKFASLSRTIVVTTTIVPGVIVVVTTIVPGVIVVAEIEHREQ